MLESIRVFATVAAAVIALAAFFLSCIALFTSASVARAQLYLELRKLFSEINDELPRLTTPGSKDYHDAKWRPTPESDPTDFLKIEKYWYRTFDQWFVTKILHPWPFQRLWTVFFERAVFEGLKNVPIRYVLYYMVSKESRTSFSGRGEEFVEDLTAVYKKYNHDPDYKKIFSGF